MAEKTYQSPDGKHTRVAALPRDEVNLKARGWTEVKASAAKTEKSDTNTKS